MILSGSLLVFRVQVGRGVLVGPGFRVVKCDCRPHHERASDYCPFCLCRCKACGGSPYGRASSYSTRNDDPLDLGAKYGWEDSEASLKWGVLMCVLMLLALVLLCLSVHTPYFCTPALAIVAFLLMLVETWPSSTRRASR